MTVLIAGGGIAGLSLALTCHQIGVPFRVFEAADEIRPLGVGINLQPSAVRELYDLGLKQPLERIGIPTRDYGMYSKYGLEIWTEPRGRWAGYDWPQFSVHRGLLLMMLYEHLVRRAGTAAVETGWRARGFENVPGGARLLLENAAGETRIEEGALVLGADGIHSAIRAQMAPGEGPPVWGGNVMYRGTTQAAPFLSGASMVMIGYEKHRFITYPITAPDPETGEATINWAASIKYGPDDPWNREDYNRRANLDDFLPSYADWVFDWLDVPALIRGAETVYEYPMVDRDPLDRWTHGRITLIGDAAHPAYPVGSNGAGQAIVDCRKLGARLLEHGPTQQALEAYEAEMRPWTSKVVLANRGNEGPDAILDVVEERCGGRFDDIEDVFPKAELAAHADRYKKIAGFSIAELNALPPVIPEGARVDLG